MDFLGIFGTSELLVCAIIGLVVFGPERLPELAKHFAKITKMFRDASRELQRQIDMSEIEREIKRTTKPIKETTQSKKVNNESTAVGTDTDENPYEQMGEEMGYDGYPEYQESAQTGSTDQEPVEKSEPEVVKTVSSTSDRIMLDEGLKTQDAARFQREAVE